MIGIRGLLGSSTSSGAPENRVGVGMRGRAARAGDGPGAGGAGEHRCPTPNILPFANCPVYVKHVAHCVVATTTSGEFKLGNKTVPITKPIVLQGGIIESSHVLVPAANGQHALAHPPDRPGRPHRDRRTAPGRRSDRQHRTRGAG